MVRGRFAPSPTGDLHLGNARTALLAWLQVRSAAGRFIMRVEDLDPGRSRDHYIRTQLDDLRWLGLDWDEGPDIGGDFGPYLQSLRHDRYSTALRRLADQGALFSCFCTRREIMEAASAPHGGDDEGPRYPGTCLALPRSEVYDRSGEPAALRYKIRPGAVSFQDGLLGQQCFTPFEEVGPFVIRRKDGVASYQLAVVVDDIEMAVTHVVRGADLLSSTARQIQLYRALGCDPPLWIHVPLMLGADGERLSKRNGAISLGELRDRGVAPEAVVGWLAWTCGLLDRPREADARSLVGDFDLDRVRTQPTEYTAPPFARHSRTG